jgi:hypothetical protein
MTPDPRPWSDAPDPAWVSEVDAWTWERAADWEWRKHGFCPYCKHTMTVKVEAGGVVFARPRPLRAWCNCRAEHPGNPMPEGQRVGCGRQGIIHPPPTTEDP